MSQHTQKGISAEDTVLRTLTQVLRAQENHTMLLQKVLEVITAEPETSEITLALHALSENVQAQTQAIAAQMTHVAAMHRAMDRIADALDEGTSKAGPQPSGSRHP